MTLTRWGQRRWYLQNELPDTLKTASQHSNITVKFYVNISNIILQFWAIRKTDWSWPGLRVLSGAILIL